MFAEAIRSVQDFARPVVISQRRMTGKCQATIATFVVINRDGWAVTAWHVLDILIKATAEAADYVAIMANRAAVLGDSKLTDRERRQKLKRFPEPRRNAITNVSAWWSFDGAACDIDVKALPSADVAFFKLHRFDPGWVATYPVFKNPASAVEPGRSLCRVGFPFHGIEPVFRADRNAFELPPGSVPLPRFPNDGIYTRDVEVLSTPGAPKPSFPLRFLETSSPGLMGQSGGPIFDVEGRIWAIQSRTVHYPLGFSPPVPNGRQGEVEHQFMNVGWGVHVETLVGAMRDNGIQFEMSTD